MTHTLPSLPYNLDALAPHISRETLEFHYGKHHQTYVDNLNKLIPGTEYETMSLEDIIQKAPAGGIFNNAAQIWNHTFYFESLAPAAHHIPSQALHQAINDRWTSVDNFMVEFHQKAVSNFGSGWTWLVKRSDDTLDIVNTSNAMTPFVKGEVMKGQGDLVSEQNPQSSASPQTAPLQKELIVPLLTCDVWEHAYYIDYRNARAKYLENFWKVVNWKKVSERYGK